MNRSLFYLPQLPGPGQPQPGAAAQPAGQLAAPGVRPRPQPAARRPLPPHVRRGEGGMLNL